MKMRSRKTCPCPCGCQAFANTLEEIDKIFGWRGKITQSYCKKCRGTHKQNKDTSNIPSIFKFILNGMNKDYLNTPDYSSIIPRYDNNGKRLSNKEKNKLKNEYFLEKIDSFVRDFLKLIDEKDSLISVKQFSELFEIYNFYVKKPEKESFFDFIISNSDKIKIEQQLDSKEQIFVIVKLYSEFTETHLKILSEKLKNSSAIIINFVTYIHQDFIKNNDQICILDRNMIKYLLKHRIGLNNVSLEFLFGSESGNKSQAGSDHDVVSEKINQMEIQRVGNGKFDFFSKDYSKD